MHVAENITLADILIVMLLWFVAMVFILSLTLERKDSSTNKNKSSRLIASRNHLWQEKHKGMTFSVQRKIGVIKVQNKDTD